MESIGWKIEDKLVYINLGHLGNLGQFMSIHKLLRYINIQKMEIFSLPP